MNKSKQIILISILLVMIFIPLVFVFSDYTLMAPLPGSPEVEKVNNLTVYLEALFKYAITIAAILAVIMIVIGGLQYIGAAGNTSVIEDAKDRIYWAIVGLILALGSWLILNTINPELKELKLPDMKQQSIEDLTKTELFSEIKGDTSEVIKKSAEYFWLLIPAEKDCNDKKAGCIGVDESKCKENMPIENNTNEAYECCACPIQ